MKSFRYNTMQSVESQLNISEEHVTAELLGTCFHASFLRGLFFDPEDGGNMFLWTIWCYIQEDKTIQNTQWFVIIVCPYICVCVTCYATEDAVRIVNLFYLQSHTRNYNHNYFLRSYAFTQFTSTAP
jgi:hypothetical protein